MSTAPSTTPGGTTQTGPVFIDDDVPSALAAARGAGKVVFVDAWAPWCHTCLSMQREVLSQPALARFADRVVFVAVDTDRPENVEFLSRSPVRVWPTFFILDPTREAPLAVRPGSMSLDETIAFLEGALVARDPSRVTDPQVRELLRAHEALAKGDQVAAAQQFTAAARLPGPRRAEAILGALRVLADPARCTEFGLEHLLAVEHGGAPGDVAASVLACAERLPADAPARREATARVKARLIDLARTPAPGAAIDDRADVLAQLADLHDAAGDKAAFVATHEERLRLLEDAARGAASVEAARVHDYARMGSYLALGRGADAVAMLTERTHQLPTSYEAWARLASTLYKLGRHAEARVAAEKAVTLSYGVRRLRYLNLLADVAASEGDAGAEQAALRRLLEEAAAMTRQVQALGAEGVVDAARKRLAKLVSGSP